MQRDVFQAIADPTRRAIIDLLAEQQLPVKQVASNFDMSRPAVSKHLKILDECGLVVIRKKGRKRLYRSDPRKLQEVAEWASRYKKFWTQKLDALEMLLNEESQSKEEKL
ncbi:ArsR/SmtB family transcription factor [Fodinibius salsisoli]|uniref:Winged helix-turn-helix transcriptional regulator n=1 Tax=Fodinibius salsisoli TaxID=2820877 RepID=A0ABT3PIA3_9BACT|nr:metalloregulator ArsR/SmtB family transcription factor [Fodinibius salsisoli]MCW9705660.1 winged helix-turn-helix transcriptional regulator [Fodinibius salsisoli]